MRILAIDDQKLSLYPLEKTLTREGYDFKGLMNPRKAKEVIADFKPDLVIVDLNMPFFSGLEIVEYIRKEAQLTIPVIVLTGDVNKVSIVKAFELGVNDYLKKPISLKEIVVRINKVLGKPNDNIREDIKARVEKSFIGLVIPLQNNEKLLKSEAFINFIENTSGCFICFANNGSTDNTLAEIEKIRKGREDKTIIYNFKKPLKRSEAVRLSVLYLHRISSLDFVGYINTWFIPAIESWKKLPLQQNRVTVGVAKKTNGIKYSLYVKLIFKMLMRLDFSYMNVGFIAMDKKIVEGVFREKFLSQYLLNVEVLMRLKRHFSKNDFKNLLQKEELDLTITLEEPTSFKRETRLLKDFVRVAKVYKNEDTFIGKSNYEDFFPKYPNKIIE
ncbi:response regulator [Mesonia aquimarina]|uniref:response regulator n=1 Tax=Mesonia aquimarina TaxID=1504967 RepID=UPI000EF57397|nr:response regulator [Mesonia aquimarina]